MLAACATMAPPYQAPALPVAASYPGDPTPGGTRAAAVGWRDYFRDPELQALIAQAIDNNRDLRVTALRVAEARAAYGIQRAGLFPTVNGQAALDRSRTPADLGLPGVPLTFSDYQVNLGATSWEIDFWGRVRSLRDAALEDFLASESSRRAAAVSLVAQVATSYLTLCELNERLNIARETVATRMESLRISSRRVAVGSTSRLQLTQVQTLLTDAQTVSAQLSQSRAAQFNALTLLVGAPVTLPSPLHELGDGAALAELAPGLPSELLTERPDILAAEHKLRAAHANIGAARAAFFPNITLTSSLGTASAQLDGLFKSGSLAWNFAPSISLPLFDGGLRRNNLDVADTRREIEVANYEKAIQSAFRDVADALSANDSLVEQLAIAKAALAIQTERARLSQLRFDNGGAAFLEVLDAQRDLLSAEQQLVQSRRALLTNRVSLYAALGGGAMDHAQRPVP